MRYRAKWSGWPNGAWTITDTTAKDHDIPCIWSMP